jgi:hypothetical protein
MNKAARKEKNQRMAQDMKRRGEERTSGRCPVCYAVYHADMLKAGYQAHRCKSFQK